MLSDAARRLAAATRSSVGARTKGSYRTASFAAAVAFAGCTVQPTPAATVSVVSFATVAAADVIVRPNPRDAVFARVAVPVEAAETMRLENTAMQLQATPGSLRIAGRVTDALSRAPVAFAMLVLGRPPDPRTCSAGRSCGRPGAPSYRGTSNASGKYDVAGVPPGTYMLSLSKSSAYATLHALVDVRAGHSRLDLRLLALSHDERAWLADINRARRTISFPRASGDLVIDQYAESIARRWAASIASGAVAYGDPGFAPFGIAYQNAPGSMYGRPAAVSDLQSRSGAYAAADLAWMAKEKPNCPSGDWRTCPPLSDTGHYINLSNAGAVWVGLGESSRRTGSTTSWPGYNAYTGIIVQAS